MNIEKNIEIPPRQNERDVSIYPFPHMDIGESVLFKAEEHGPGWSDALRARQCAYQYGRRYGKKFRARRVIEGIRIWRIE